MIILQCLCVSDVQIIVWIYNIWNVIKWQYNVLLIINWYKTIAVFVYYKCLLSRWLPVLQTSIILWLSICWYCWEFFNIQLTSFRDTMNMLLSLFSPTNQYAGNSSISPQFSHIFFYFNQSDKSQTHTWHLIRRTVHTTRGYDPPRLFGRCVLKSSSGDIGDGWLGAAGNPRGYLQSRSVGLNGSGNGRRSIAATGGRERGSSFITQSSSRPAHCCCDSFSVSATNVQDNVMSATTTIHTQLELVHSLYSSKLLLS